MAISAPLPLVLRVLASRAPPRPAAVWTIALAGCAAGVVVVRICSYERRNWNSHLGEPLVIATLWNWMTLAYVLGRIAGVVAPTS